MPHKHRRIEEDESQFDLPPTVRAAPLPVGKARTFNTAPKGKKRKIQHVEGYGADDTPKAFQRLMALSKGGVKKRSGLDDGHIKTKKQKKAEQKAIGDAEQENTSKSEVQAQPKAVLKIQPGESMAEFRARVDQALPLSGVAKAGKRVAGVSDHRVTKHERRLKRLQKGWREEEARIREKEMEEKELAEEEQDELDAMWEDKKSDLPATTNGKKSKKKKNKRKLVVGEIDNNSEDEWEALKRNRDERKGLHDVVSAPPTFDKVPREIFKVKNGAGAKVGNVPNAAGSLRKREELGEERKTIIDTYRELMAAKKKA
ncbi:hypothetical protein N0V83_010613 [Neocucurbitaria cava]|uniref:Uncharacterized protein n=1 Tax=Neocucurbitaria cava TaxID=798079 RepID=A0A9W9CHH9_9PLEO|nr:hypothetical protein N0V83_010613 [Neocucurbitaria cava]